VPWTFFGPKPPLAITVERNNVREDHSIMAKSTCSVTRQEFLDKAKPVSVTIGANTMLADVKEFSTGSLGWYLNGKATLEIDGKPVQVQIGLNLTLVGSKDLPKEGQAAA
jgi:hypothetical protein